MKLKKNAFISLLSIVLFSVTASVNSQEEKVELKASIQKQEVTLQTIRDLRLDIKRVRSGASAIFDEVTREPVNFTMAPNVVGSTIINPITVKESGVLEPRSDWIKHSLEKMGPTIELLRKDVESIDKDERALALSEKTQKELDVLRSDWVILVKNIYKEYDDLKKLTQNRTKPCDNLGVASRSRKIYLMGKRLEKTRRKAEKLLLKELKKRKREARNR